MKRLKLLGLIVLLAAALAAVVAVGSPYAPVVQPVMEIEDIWAIEDARTESAAPLVTALENNGVPLAYDASVNTFYCTLGMGHEDAWPEIHLTAPGAKDVELVFVDDYTYDWCSDALRDGYPYQVMAYTDEEFAYFDVVFTGLMQVCITSKEALSAEDKPIEVSIHTAEGALKSYARTHYRGGITINYEKHPYKIEFTKTADGQNKVAREVPGLGQMNQFILISMWYDNDLLRDRLSWSMYGELVGADKPYGARRHSYAEVFVNDRYEGVYLLLEPYEHATEIAKEGSEHVTTDSVYCSCPMHEVLDRPTKQGAFVQGRGFALHHLAQGQGIFDALEDYIEIGLEKDDQRFIERMNEQIDMDSLLLYHHIMQSFGLSDNMFNNQFVWAVWQDGKYVYRFIPWDMDMSWGEDDHLEWILEDYDGWMYFPILDRMLNLNPDGIRTRWAELWRQLRSTVLTVENVEEKVMRYSNELNGSGAILRNSERWGNNNPESDPFEIMNYAQMRFEILDRTVEYIENAEGDIPMLMYDDYELESGQIYGFDGREKEVLTGW